MHPFLIPHSSFLLPTYVFIMSMIYCFSLIWAVKRADDQNISRHRVLDYSLAIMILGCVGARLFHVLFEYPDYYIENPLDIFLLYQGGFVFYGGFLFVLLGCFIIVKYRRDRLTIWLDFFTPIVALGYAVGRLGCFLAGCCYGKSSDLIWSVTFPLGVEAPANTHLHPTQLYSSLLGFMAFIFVLFAERKKIFPTGGLFFGWLLLHSISRFIVEPFRGDWRGETFLSLSLSSWVSSLLAVTALLALFYCGKASSKSG